VLPVAGEQGRLNMPFDEFLVADPCAAIVAGVTEVRRRPAPVATAVVVTTTVVTAAAVSRPPPTPTPPPAAPPPVTSLLPAGRDG
jgi:hypothetical protein